MRMRRFGTPAAAALIALALLAAPATAAARTPDPYTPGVIVATAPSGTNAYFPDIVRLAGGRLLAVYRVGAAHTGMDGRLMSVTSADGGRTWSRPRALIDTPYDDRDPKVTQVPGGDVLVSFFEIDWTDTPATTRGTYVVRSHDVGTSWSAPAKIGTHMTGPSGTSDSGYWLGWDASHGPITRAPDGDLLAPLYGTLPTDKWQRATVVRSTDDGRTWKASSEVVIAAKDGTHFQEPVLTTLRDGEVVALIRTGTGIAYVSRSRDSGRTWTAPRSTGIPASSHHLLRLRDGRVLLTYGDVSGRFSAGRPTVGRLVAHPERSFAGSPDVLLYDAGGPGGAVSDQANPSSAEPSPGRFLTLTYDLSRHAIVGVFSRTRDYAP
ncbi:MAG TPA: sialidase family protein [Streptosporangiaceae bacterium]|jgi:hypothetical protein